MNDYKNFCEYVTKPQPTVEIKMKKALLITIYTLFTLLYVWFFWLNLKSWAMLILLPFIVSITYELNRWVGRHDNLLISRIIAWPGKQMQHITTYEPDDSMIEVAIRAMELVIPDEKGSDAWGS